MKILKSKLLKSLNKYAPKGIEFIFEKNAYTFARTDRYEDEAIGIKMPNGKTSPLFTSHITAGDLNRLLEGIETSPKGGLDELLDKRIDELVLSEYSQNMKRNGYKYTPKKEEITRDWIEKNAHMEDGLWAQYETKGMNPTNLKNIPTHEMLNLQKGLEENTRTSNEDYQKVNRFIRGTILDSLKRMIKEEGIEGLVRTEKLFKKSEENLKKLGISKFEKSGVVKLDEKILNKMKKNKNRE